MPALSSARHEKFAQGVASGLTGAAAYRQVLRLHEQAGRWIGDQMDGRIAQASVSASMN